MTLFLLQEEERKEFICNGTIRVSIVMGTLYKDEFRSEAEMDKRKI